MWRYRRQLKHLRKKIGIGLESVSTSLKIGDKVKLREVKQAVVNHQWAVDMFIVICGIMQIISVSPQHRYLHQCGYECKASALGKHMKGDHDAKEFYYLTQPNFQDVPVLIL